MLHLLWREQAPWLLTAKNKPLRSLSVLRLPPFVTSGFVPPFPRVGSRHADAEHWLRKASHRWAGGQGSCHSNEHGQWPLSGPAGDNLSSAVTGEGTAGSWQFHFQPSVTTSNNNPPNNVTGTEPRDSLTTVKIRRGNRYSWVRAPHMTTSHFQNLHDRISSSFLQR